MNRIYTVKEIFQSLLPCKTTRMRPKKTLIVGILPVTTGSHVDLK